MKEDIIQEEKIQYKVGRGVSEMVTSTEKIGSVK